MFRLWRNSQLKLLGWLLWPDNSRIQGHLAALGHHISFNVNAKVSTLGPHEHSSLSICELKLLRYRLIARMLRDDSASLLHFHAISWLTRQLNRPVTGCLHDSSVHAVSTVHETKVPLILPQANISTAHHLKYSQFARHIAGRSCNCRLRRPTAFLATTTVSLELSSLEQ